MFERDQRIDCMRKEWPKRKSLRSAYIDYCHGWFFVTIQTSGNKSVFGAIVEDKCILNELGNAVKDAWLTEPRFAPGLQIFDFQVMPNHFHALLYYRSPEHGRGDPCSTGGTTTVTSSPVTSFSMTPNSTVPRPSGSPVTAPGSCGLKPSVLVEEKYSRDSKERDLPYVIGIFKSWTTRLYHRMKEEGRCINIGNTLWQDRFYDRLVRSAKQFDAIAAYIRANPRNWNLDRFGPVTGFFKGNLELLDTDYVAYLSSEGYSKSSEFGKVPVKRYSLRHDSVVDEAKLKTRPVISTFTSYYERQILEKCLKTGRSFIWVCPGGIGQEILAKISTVVETGQALLISPVAPETGINKQRANWCNQFIVKNADEIWVGHIRPGGSLEAILKGSGRGLS